MNVTTNAPEVLEQLCGRLDELERRVLQLEQREIVAAPSAGEEHGPTERLTPAEKAAPPVRPNGWLAMGPVVTVSGIALLGIAGAYVLRALAGASVFSRPLLGFLGAAYATGWAVAGARASRPLAQGVYAAASVVILAPMLWEMCLRFQAISPLVAALVLCGYLVIVCASVRSGFRSPAFSIVYAGSAVAALALCIGTRSMMPFVAILLAMVTFEEFRRMRGEPLAAAALVWLVADAAILAILAVYRLPSAARPEYPALSPFVVLTCPILLFVIQTAATAHHGCIRRRSIAVLDAMQWMAAFALLVLGVCWMAPSSGRLTIGFLCMALCAGCYWAGVGQAVDATPRGNFRIFTTWAFLLLIAGLLRLLPAGIAAVALGCAALLAILAAKRMQSMTLQVHALGLILVGALACGLPVYLWRAMVTDATAHPGWSVLATSTIMLAVYAVCGERKAESDGAQVVHFALALTAWCAVCAVLTHLLAMAIGLLLRPEAAHVALVRTIALCLLILAIVITGARLERAAMIRVAYVLLGLVAVKLVFEDLRHGNFGYLAASIGIVAGTLLAMPRISGGIGARGPDRA